MRFVLAEVYDADPTFDYGVVRMREGPTWRLVTEQPIHLLDPQYSTWDDLFLASVDAVIDEARQGREGDLATRTWGEYNMAAYRHPLSAGVPLLRRWLDMPVEAFPGDVYTPRVHWRSIAASVRMIVSPGREEEGIMHMPTGQSGQPWSPFYRSSHEAWSRGEAAPLLPGPAVHHLVLEP
jgi:penicillin G amidase